jgi:phosphate transport system permease protein
MATTTQQPPTIARPPTAIERAWDTTFQTTTRVFAWLTILVVTLVVGLIAWEAFPAIQRYGLDFITGTEWNPGKEQYGILPEIVGTMYSSILGVGIGAVFGVAVAIFLTQDFIPPWAENVFKNIINLLAAIPSVVYGLWGIFVVIPTIRPACNWLHVQLGWVPFFRTPLLSVGLLPAALVLAIMVLPTITAISRDALASVNPKLREAAFGLGATRWEAILGVILPTSRRGIYGSIFLGFGRAIGETMALAMLVGSANVPNWSLSNPAVWSVFSPADTLAALLANKFPEAASKLDLGVLMYAALVLLALTLLVNILGELIIRRSTLYTTSKPGKGVGK